MLHDGGGASVRVNVPKPLWMLCEAFARSLEIDPVAALNLLLQKLNGIVADAKRGDTKLLAMLGPEITEVLREARQSGRDIDTSIDLSKLHMNPKVKSGFMGVYANGSGFRASARLSDGSLVHLGTYATAEEASWARYLYYQKHDLPYGAWEDAILARRAKGMGGSDADLIFDYEDGNRLVGREHLNSAPGRPKAPSTLVIAGNDDAGSITDELELMRAQNDALLDAKRIK